MAGGAADCTYLIRAVRSRAGVHELEHGYPMTLARASSLLSSMLYQNRHLGLSVGTMIVGYDSTGPSLYYLDNTGVRLKGDVFSVGSGSTLALGILDKVEDLRGLSEDEAVEVGIRAIRAATFRDASSGGYINVYVINKDGWRKVFSEDLALG